MAQKHILSLRLETQSSKRPTHQQQLLLRVQPSQNSKGTTKLSDLSFQATEGSQIYTGFLPTSRLSKTLLPNAGLTVPELEAVLVHLLLQAPLPPGAAGREELENIHLIALRAGSSSEVKLRLQRTIGDVKHYIAEISLAEAPDEEIDVFEWALTAISHSVTIADEVSVLRERARKAESDVVAVKGQVGELVRVKAEDEAAMLGRVVRVLESKKARVRELEMQLGRGQRPWPEVPEIKEEVVDEDDVGGKGSGRGRGRGGERGRGAGSVARGAAKAGPSRVGKRKQVDVPVEPEPEVDDDEEDDEVQEEQRRRDDEDVETDKESLQDQAENGDVGLDISDDEDDLDAVIPSQKPAAIEKQHAHRTRGKTRPEPEDDEEETDDEL